MTAFFAVQSYGHKPTPLSAEACTRSVKPLVTCLLRLQKHASTLQGRRTSRHVSSISEVESGVEKAGVPLRCTWGWSAFEVYLRVVCFLGVPAGNLLLRCTCGWSAFAHQLSHVTSWDLHFYHGIHKQMGI